MTGLLYILSSAGYLFLLLANIFLDALDVAAAKGFHFTTQLKIAANLIIV
jgi:hypothetical protein